MRILIVGAGEVGTHLAKLLSRENMDISLMDEDAARLGVLDANYDLITKRGNPTSIHDLKDLGVKDCDLFISVTPHETENMTACLIANQLGAKKTLAVLITTSTCCPRTNDSSRRWVSTTSSTPRCWRRTRL